ncbi:MAG: class I SAM-dependent methyltransferase [Sphingomonas sp.]|nr:class I SAM-dependent methyltransferase [Sphingomonas sp.]
MRNIDEATVAGFGQEWSEYDQVELGTQDLQSIFDSYFAIFPFEDLPSKAEGFDLGCGSGRWADLVLAKVGRLHCIDPSELALSVARRRLAGRKGAVFHQASVDDMPLSDNSQDFGYSLGVLHHVPDTAAAMAACVRKLKPGAPFLVYLYHSFDNRPFWYRPLWAATDVARKGISRMPFLLRKSVTSIIAAFVYWPLARTAKLAERMGRNVVDYPLSIYRDRDFYVMRTDALDRFGTRLEHRFSRAEIEQMMSAAGLEEIRFSERPPFWVACGRRSR